MSYHDSHVSRGLETPMPDPITRLNASLEGRYTIERELGEGGIATVNLADDLPHYPLKYSTYAYEVGVNMIIYAMSH